MRTKYFLLALIASFGLTAPVSFSQPEAEQPKAEASAAPGLIGSWRPLEKMETAEGAVPELTFFANGKFRIVDQAGEQLSGEYKIEDKDGKKIITLSYPEVNKALSFTIIKLDEKNLEMENVKTKKITRYERIEQKTIKNPLLPE